MTSWVLKDESILTQFFQCPQNLVNEVESGKLSNYADLKIRLNQILKDKDNDPKSDGDELNSEHKIRLANFSKSFESYYSEIYPSLKNYSGPITNTHKDNLKKVKDHLQELQDLVDDLIARPEAEKPERGEPGCPKGSTNKKES